MVDLVDPNVVQTEELCIEAVKLDGYRLEYVKDQTEAICMCAVKRNGLALRYVHNQTEAICIEAVKRHSYALKYVHNQTEAICMEAVKQNGYALRHVINQTEAICMEAVKQNGYVLVHVINQTEIICLVAIDNYFKEDIQANAFVYMYNLIKYPSPQLVIQLVKLYPSRTDVIMNSYAQNIITIYKTSSDTICADLVQHVNDLLYRPNSVNALVSQTNWHAEQTSAKSVFLMM